jgi:hypothetical protein
VLYNTNIVGYIDTLLYTTITHKLLYKTNNFLYKTIIWVFIAVRHPPAPEWWDVRRWSLLSTTDMDYTLEHNTT